MFQRVVRESHKHVKNHCDLCEKLGNSNFHDRLLVLYTKKAPQLSAQELIMFTKNMAASATRCCPLSDEQQVVCVEDSKLCFDDLQVDGTYISPPLSCDQVISFQEDLCKAQEEEFQTEKHKLLSNLVAETNKQKPYATEMQLKPMIVDFIHLAEPCCQAEKREMCFPEEESKLIEKCQSLLGG